MSRDDRRAAATGREAIERPSPSRIALFSALAQRQILIVSLLIAGATLAFYNPIIDNHFIQFDDAIYILNNPQVQQGLTWDTVKWSFTTLRAGYWHPVTWLSHSLDCQLFGVNPAGHHYVNLLLHAINAVLLFVLLRAATGLTLPSFLVGALFALHPVNVESVAWAAERKNLLSMLFFLLAMLAYDRYARTGRRALYFSVILLFAFGLMAKPQIVTLPFVLLLWDYWPLERLGPQGLKPASLAGRYGTAEAVPFPKASHDGTAEAEPFPKPFVRQVLDARHSLLYLVIEKLPLFGLAAADSFVIFRAQSSGHAVRTAAEVAWSSRVANAFVSYARYLEKAFWPSRLAALYPRAADGLPAWQVSGAVALLLFLSVLVLYYRDRRYLMVGWFWFLGTLVPMLGIISVGEQAMADRFAYLPFVGLFIAVVWTLSALLSQRRVARVCGAGVAVSACLILGCLTYHQVGYWHDDETLWKRTLSITDHNYMAHNNLAYALAEEGRVDEAIANFRAARALHEYPADQVVKLAFYELRMGYPQDALEECQAALNDHPDPAVRLAAFRTMGRALLDLRRYDEADQSFREALRLAADDSDSLVNRGLLALRSGDAALAVASFSDAARISPSDVNLLLLAQAYRRNGQMDDAGRAQARAQKISLNFAQSEQAVAQFLALADVKPL